MPTHDPATIVGYINSCANDLAEVELSTGTVLTGRLSPYSDDSDHIRLNPEPPDEGMHHVTVLQHIVRIRLIIKPRDEKSK
jgi:hypothetical protein